MALPASALGAGSAPLPGLNTTYGTGSSTGAIFFKNTVGKGSTVSSVTPSTGLVTMKNVSITKAGTTCTGSNTGISLSDPSSSGQPVTCTASVTATGTVYIGNDSTGLAGTMSYSDDSDWSIAIASGAAGSGYVQPTSVPINENALSGAISMSGGVLSSTLSLPTLTWGSMSGTNVPVSVTANGPVASLVLSTITSSSHAQLATLVEQLSNSSQAQAVIQWVKTNSPDLPVTVKFTDRNDWTATVSGSATGTQGSATLSGTITDSGGTISTDLQFQGSVGDASFTVDGTLTQGGVTGTVTLSNVTISGEYAHEQTTISHTTTDPYKQGGDKTGEWTTVTTTTMDQGDVTLVTGTGTMSSNSPVMQVGGTISMEGSTLAGNVAYTDANDWTLSIAANSAGSGYTPSSSTAFNLNALSGTITTTAGVETFNLTLSGATVGNATFNAAVAYDGTGFTASAEVDNLVIGGMTINSAAIDISTESPSASISGDIQTDAGTFDGSIAATGQAGGAYTLAISVSGANLTAGSSEFEFTSFSFSTTVDAPATGCTDVTASAAGTLVMGNMTYSINDITLAFSCSTMTEFTFSVSVVHTPTFTGKSETFTLDIAWYGTITDWAPRFGPTGEFWGPQFVGLSGFFGSIDMSESRTFSDWYNGKTFSESVTLGLAFYVAVYTPLDGGTDAAVGAMGYFAADRISGDISCEFNVYPQTDFTCGGTIKVNPPNAGKYSYKWSGI